MRERTGDPYVKRTKEDDLDKGRPFHHHGATSISEKMLVQEVQDKLAPSITEHELLDRINLALDKIIEHFEEITGEKFTVEDIMEWL